MGNLFSSKPKTQKNQSKPVVEQTPSNNLLERESENFRTISQSPTGSPISTNSTNTTFSNNRTSTVCSNNRTISSTYSNYSSWGNKTTISKNSSNNSINNISSTRVNHSVTTILNADYKKFQQILYNAVINQSFLLNWYAIPENIDYQLINLETWGVEYDQLFTKFTESVLGEIYILQIQRIENPYLLGQYYLKKLEYQNKNLPVYERDLFHGTKYENVDSICRDNFDWRLHGSTKGNIFGKGVSFTPKSSYANHYCDRRGEKVMIVAKVLISKTCAGNKDMTIPDYYDRSRLLRFDTSVKEPTRDVLVKYCDDEFYPAYLIHYTGQMYYPMKGFYR